MRGNRFSLTLFSELPNGKLGGEKERKKKKSKLSMKGCKIKY